MDRGYHWLFREEAGGTARAPFEGRVGSPFVPRLERLHLYFGELISRIYGLRPGDLNGWIHAHNLYTVYVWLVLMWATAIRPHRDPLITCKSLLGPRDWLIIGDKNNGTFEERRPVPVCMPAWELLITLEQGTESFCGWLASEGHPVAVDDELLFVIIRNAKGKALTPDLARAVLENERLGYVWKFNAARHYWISTWLALERPLVRIEAFLGHIHQGTEPWGPFSLASLSKWGEEFRARSKEILASFGIQMLPHPFREDRV